MTISIVIGGESFPFDGLARYSLPQKKYRAMILSAFKYAGEILPSEEISIRCILYQRSIHTIRRHLRFLCQSGEIEKVRMIKNRTSIWAYRVKR
jgi:hypothetical protein